MIGRWSQFRFLLPPLIAIYLLIGWVPFEVEWPAQVAHSGQFVTTDQGNRVLETGDGPTVAGGGGWIYGIKTGNEALIALDVRPDDLNQRGVILASGPGGSRANLLVAQDRTSLRVRFRSADIWLDGLIEDAFTEVAARRIVLRRRNGEVTVRVDGEDRFERTLSQEVLDTWNGDYDAYLGATGDDRNRWRGTIGEASVEVGGERFDLLDEAVETTGSHWFVPDIPDQLGLDSALIFDFFRNFLGFAPLGAAVMLVGRRSTVRRAALVGFAVSLTIEVGQILMPGRFTVILDLVLNTGGAAFGAWIITIIATRWPAVSPGRDDEDPDVVLTVT